MNTKNTIISAIIFGLIVVVGSFIVSQDININTPFGANPGPDYINQVNLKGGVIYGYTNSTTTTATTQTLALTDVMFNKSQYYDTIFLTPNTGDLTLTWFASSTAPNYLPVAGNRHDFCLRNATTTAGIDITIAAGTGIDLESATTTLTILADSTACFTAMRKAASASAFDIELIFKKFVNAD